MTEDDGTRAVARLVAAAIEALRAHVARSGQPEPLVMDLLLAAHERMQDRVPREQSGPPLVHVLEGGFPLCHFSSRWPVGWGAGHAWVAMPEWATATCGGCRENAQRLLRRWEGL